MAASFSDSNQLRQDTTFQGRVRAGMLTYCNVVANEGWTVAFHRERASFVVQVLSAPDNFVPLFASTVACDATVIGDATQAGTVVLTSGNVAAQGALVTDAHISNAVAQEFNSYFRVPGS